MFGNEVRLGIGILLHTHSYILCYIDVVEQKIDITIIAMC